MYLLYCTASRTRRSGGSGYWTGENLHIGTGALFFSYTSMGVTVVVLGGSSRPSHKCGASYTAYILLVLLRPCAIATYYYLANWSGRGAEMGSRNKRWVKDANTTT